MQRNYVLNPPKKKKLRAEFFLLIFIVYVLNFKIKTKTNLRTEQVSAKVNVKA